MPNPASASPPRAPARAAPPRPGRRAWLTLAVVSALVLATSTTLMLLRIEPFVTWFYVTAWYPTLVLIDCGIAARVGRPYLLDRPRYALSLFLWSAVLWFVFEVVDFRVQNWYYVFVPDQRPVRWLGITLSFMTVLPALFLAERWLAARRVAADVRWPRLRVTRRLERGLFLLGVAFVALTLTWPHYFYPLVWGAVTLLLEPGNHRRDPTRSLLGDLEAGRPGRILRLLLGGLAIGFIWELYNVAARGKWIYTVPGLESLKLFEMPLLGFFGFPVFALDCFVVYRALVSMGIAVGSGAEGLRIKRTAVAASLGVAFAVLTLLGMERWNIDSYTPRLERLWVVGPAERARLTNTPYDDVFALARARPDDLAAEVGVPVDTARTWASAARLVTLRGIGIRSGQLLWRAGVRSVADLAAADPDRLGARLRELAERPHAATPAKVRVWIRAARRAVGPSSGRAPGPGSG